jgi:hypothetical protein
MPLISALAWSQHLMTNDGVAAVITLFLAESTLSVTLCVSLFCDITLSA